MIRESMLNLLQLLRAWWKVDRIRIPATTGRLLQLSPGDRLLIHEHVLMVRKRSVVQCSAEPDADQAAASTVEYRLVDLLDDAVDDAVCQADKIFCSCSDEWRLQILLQKDSQACVHRLWIRRGVEELLEEEIVLLRSP